MREILFRGKRHNGEWYYGSYLFLNVPDRDWKGDTRGKPEPVHYIINGKDINYAVDPDTVGQYTGQIAQGVRVFEGDIFRYGDEAYVVKWDAEGAKFYCYCLDGSGWISDFLEIHWEVAEIIGNIHDNPELLED